MIEIKEINEREIWENFLNKEKPNTFLQSWAWLEMNKTLGEKVVALGAFENNELKGIASGITVTAKRGNFLFSPHAPITKGGFSEEIYKELLNELSNRAKKMGMVALRVSPLELENENTKKYFKTLGFRPSPIHMHAENMWILNISENEDQILKGMRKTTRNLIRRAERDGVKVTISNENSDLEKFMKIYTETAKREGFVAFSKDFLKAEFNSFVPRNGFVVLAEKDDVVLAGALITTFANSGFYHQGASTHSKYPAAYLLHWEIIKELKRRGFQKYNFWGVSSDENKNHPWAGLSLFKKGFGGQQFDYLHAQDKPLRRAYWFTWTIESLRRWKRKY